MFRATCIILLVLLFFPSGVLSHSGNTVTILITDQGFDPKESTIQQGDRVVFRNKTADLSWPASDVHPTHEIYPELDPKKPLLKETEWSVVLETVGEFNLHDHLKPDKVGKIIVEPKKSKVIVTSSTDRFFQKVQLFIRTLWQKLVPNALIVEKVDEANQLTDIVFIPPKPYELDEVYRATSFDCVANDFDCVSLLLEEITTLYGPRAGIEILQRLIIEEKVDERIDTHQLSHRIGRETARRFGMNSDGFLLCPMNDFNGGCQHGFFELALGYSDNAVSAAQQICGALESNKYSNKDSFYCYHGVGHGVMMAQAYKLESALSVCDSLPKHFMQDGCWQGVFMENVNAAILDFAPDGVFSKEDPLLPCTIVDEKYKHECYINHAGWIMKVHQSDMVKAIGNCSEIEEPHKTTCLSSLGLMVTNPVWQKTLLEESSTTFYEDAKSLCLLFPDSHRSTCVKSGVDNLMNFSNLDPSSAVVFCDLYSGDLATACYQQIAINLRVQSTPLDSIEDLCLQINNKQAQDLCLGN